MTRAAYFFSNGLMLILLFSRRLYWSRYFGVLSAFCSDNPSVTYEEGMVLPYSTPSSLMVSSESFCGFRLASLTNLDNLLCDKLRDRIASFNQVELTQRVLIGFGQHCY